MKKATTITPSSLFKPNEMFTQTTFVRVCRKKHDLTTEQSERVFESAKATGVLRHVSTWGAIAGIPIYVANLGTITI